MNITRTSIWRMGLAAAADLAGKLRAEKKVVDDAIKAVDKRLKAARPEGGIVEGELFRANVIKTEREDVNWRAVAEELAPASPLSFELLVKKHARPVAFTSVRVHAHVKAAA